MSSPEKGHWDVNRERNDGRVSAQNRTNKRSFSPMQSVLTKKINKKTPMVIRNDYSKERFQKVIKEVR